MSEETLSKTTPTPEAQDIYPERLFIMSGVWLATVFLGLAGMSAIVNPNIKIPLVDPLIDKLEQQAAKQQKSEPASTPATPPAAIAPVPSERPKPAPVQPQAQVPTATAPAAPPTPQGRSQDVPVWVYVAILISCLSGSTLITYSLYRLQRQKPQQSRRRPPQQKVKRPRQVQRRVYGESAVAAVNPAAPISAHSVPANTVPEVASLQISTPPLVNPPVVNLEPVVDPQPVALEATKADQLAAITQQAQPTAPKSLVETMDIRRRTLAPLLQDL